MIWMMRGCRLLVMSLLLGSTVAVTCAADRRPSDLENSDPTARRAAAERLAEAADPGSIAELVRAVRREEDAGIRRLMVIGLGRIGDRRAVWDLFRRLDDSRGAALWSIRTILDGKPPCSPDDPEALEALDRALREPTLAWWKDWKTNGEFQAWSALKSTPEEEVELLRDLHSPEERVALRAAERLDPHRLTLAELRIQAPLLARHPKSWALQALGRPLGTVDFPVLWANLADGDLAEADCQGRTHWALLPDAIPVLVSLLPAANQEWFRVYKGLLAWAARDTDQFRLEASRGFLYALARLKIERYGGERPGLEDIPEGRAGEGLPPAFVALARHAVRMEGMTERDREDPAAWIPPLPWLRRWARDLTPAASDLPFLIEIARGAEDLEDRAWAVQAMGRIPEPAATEALRETAGLDGEVSLFAAAELAKRGKPERFREMYESGAGDEIAEMLAFEVIPEEAIRRWIEQAARSKPQDAWEDPLFDPSAEADLERLFFYGIGVGAEVRERLAAALPIDRVPVETLAWFLTEVSATPLRGTRLEKVLARLREFELPEEEALSFDACDPGRLGALLALLEVRAPDRLVDLLHHWVERRTGALRNQALLLLGRLGDTRFAPEIIEVWAEDEFLAFDAGWLGEVRDPRVRAYLEERVRAGGEGSEAAMVALAVWLGLPDRPAGLLADLDPEIVAPDVREKVRDMLLDGDAVGAVLSPPPDVLGSQALELGAIEDSRAVGFLRRLRGDRRHYREATAGLALAGDELARRELTGLFLDGRTWIFYPVQDGRVFTFGMDPKWVDFWVDRVDATCCIGFSALESLGQLFPLLCTREGRGRTEVQDLIRRWWRRSRDHLAYSRILGGWVPTR